MNLTTMLDLVGALLLIVAVALAVAAWSVPAALGAAGAALLLLSWTVDKTKKGRGRT
ncbi:hypothetical protein V1638_04190 [Pseudarthrobacter sp. J64]|uniref:hypothetical protein n=1 Tax=Pseudarthrobacter sp. J64 TaxID=3116485 RepID=UPI002E80A73B|nr:hypothetical protein [Pseudarthrobacter sp. J64]MEE2568596.1 hypothetical protein [Pseudarthrobacter sp. J64]